MSVYEFNIGDIAECPNCGKEFEMNYFDDNEFDDFDRYLEHVADCSTDCFTDIIIE